MTKILYLACATGKLGGLFVDLVMGALFLLVAVFVILPVLIAVLARLVLLLKKQADEQQIGSQITRSVQKLQDDFREGEQDRKAVFDSFMEKTQEVGYGFLELFSFAVFTGSQAGLTVWERYIRFIRFFIQGQKRLHLVGATSLILAFCYWHFTYGVFGWFGAVLGTLLVSSAPMIAAILLQGQIGGVQSSSVSIRVGPILILVGLGVLVMFSYRDQFEQGLGKPAELKSRACSQRMAEIATEVEIASTKTSGVYPEKLDEKFGSLVCPLDSGAPYRYQRPDRTFTLHCSSSHWSKEGFQEGHPFFDASSGWALAPGVYSFQPPHEYIEKYGWDKI